MVIEAAWRLRRKGRCEKQEEQGGNTAIVMVRSGQDRSHRRSGRGQEGSGLSASSRASELLAWQQPAP